MTTDRWTTAQGLRLENEFSDANAVPYRKPTDPDTNKPKISTITKQVRKKKVTKKASARGKKTPRFAKKKGNKRA